VEVVLSTVDLLDDDDPTMAAAGGPYGVVVRDAGCGMRNVGGFFFVFSLCQNSYQISIVIF
jgi:hypothetical protein